MDVQFQALIQNLQISNGNLDQKVPLLIEAGVVLSVGFFLFFDVLPCSFDSYVINSVV